MILNRLEKADKVNIIPESAYVLFYIFISFNTDTIATARRDKGIFDRKRLNIKSLEFKAHIYVNLFCVQNFSQFYVNVLFFNYLLVYYRIQILS